MAAPRSRDLSFLDSGALAFAAPLLEAIEAPSLPLEIAGVPYTLERKLGLGGMATVYLAYDAKHDRRVAVKVLHAELITRMGGDRFVQEIRLMARLQHPHILALLDSGVFGPEVGALAGRPYYVMPFVDGESLRARLARKGTLPIAEALRVLREVADALSYAHEQGVVHRDVKPENILLSRDHAVVADFGIAKALVASHTVDHAHPTSNLMTDSSLGTPAYMAPEQAAGEAQQAQIDHRADLYAWGVVAYELLAGRHPFRDGRRMSSRALATAHLRHTPRPLQEVAPAVPGEVAALVMRCLAKPPAERPGSAAAIVTMLDRAVLTPRPVSSRRVLRRMAALGVLLLLGGLSASAYWRKRAAVHAEELLGSGDPNIDVPAVQAAVDRGGNVILKGQFSFARSPTKPVAPLLASGWYPPAAEVLVSKAVTISGVRDAQGAMTTIAAGTLPFYVDAPGEAVTIRGLRFVRPIADAILVHAVRGLEIADSKIEGVVSFAGGGEGIAINTRGEMPLPASAGTPEGVSGHLVIAHNDIDAIGGTTHDATTGIMVFSVGRSPDREVDLDIIGNQVENTTGSTLNIRRVNGRVRVLGNTLRTSHVAGPGGNDAVRLVNTGSYLMANNSIECKWADAAGIAVFSQFAEWPMERAVVEDNEVLMSPSAGTMLGDSSAGITIRGFARGVVVRHNSVRGRARAALGVSAFRGGIPVGNALINNRFDNFEAAAADIVVGSGVLRTRIVRPGTVTDLGDGTIIER
jgi:serine/threonine protein kinase